MSVELWTERYRPKTLDEYVWRDPAMRAKAEEWLAEGALPHLLLAGVQGTGKTSLALLLLRLLGIPSGDILHINASRERKVEEIQDRIGNFVSTWAMGPSGLKYVLLDEFDAISPMAQRMLRADMETYADMTRVIATCVTPETRIYTPQGWACAVDFRGGQPVHTGIGPTLTNKAMRISKVSHIRRISTAHGYGHGVSLGHRFKTATGWQTADATKVGDRLRVALHSMFGNEYSRDDDLGQAILSKDSFAAFLRSRRIWPQSAKDEARAAGIFIPSCYLGRIGKHFPRTMTTLDFAEALNTSVVAARNILKKLVKTGLIAVERGPQTEAVFAADWADVAAHIDKSWRAIVARHQLPHQGYDQFYYDGFERKNDLSLEEIVSRLEALFANETDSRQRLGRIAGYLFGDGHLSLHGLHFAANSRAPLEHVQCDLVALFATNGGDIEPNARNTNGSRIQFSNVAISLLFQFLGVPTGAKVKEAQHLPPACYLSKAFGRAFVQALFDCDGTTPRFAYRDRTIGAITLRQNTKDFTASFHRELSDYMRNELGIENSFRISKPFKTRNLPRDAAPKDGAIRACATVAIDQQDAILAFFERVGSHYEPSKHRPDMMGYLRYEQRSTTKDIMSFGQWLNAYDYVDGVIADKVVEVTDEAIDTEVYDCCLDEIHAYVTDGLISHNCNYQNKIIPALQSRFHVMQFQTLASDDFMVRVGEVLATEGVEFDIETLQAYTKATYPDLRKAISLVQHNTLAGVLAAPNAGDESASDYLLQVVDLFKRGQFLSARKLIVGQAQAEEYPDLYRFLYRNLDLFGPTQEQQDDALLVVRKGLVNHTLVADIEINLSATLVELTRIANPL